jgi:phospholipid-translocating ATPase
MTKPAFNWDATTWATDYKAAYEKCVKALANATELVYPDYALEWTLRVDASDRGVGAVLFQTALDSAGAVQHQPLSFTSKKFSEVAQRWHTYEKEAFGIFFGVNSNDYFLRGKTFLLETDHRNLLWIEKSTNPKVIRWLMYLQGFHFRVRHISGISNGVADWASRLHLLASIEPPLLLSQSDILHMCHDDRAGHLGVKRTWTLIQERYPESRISMHTVAEFIRDCAVCQKVRTNLATPIHPIARHLAQPHHRSAIGVDILTLPEDEFGNVALYVIRNMYTKLVYLQPTKSHTAEALASCIFTFFATYGLYDSIRSDPGSDLMAETVRLLNAWFGIHHVVSLVGRHTSNGVEAANRQVLRYLQSLFTDSGIVRRWSTPSIIHWVQLLMNLYDSDETGVSPFVATFGTADKEYGKIPNSLDIKSANAFISALDSDLKLVRALIRKHQSALVTRRTAMNPAAPAEYLPGDFVLLRNTTEHPPKSKLHPKSLGPYKVVKHIKNDVTVESLIDSRQRTVYVGDLAPFFGSHEEAFRMAKVDDDQVVVVEIQAYRGEPRQRRSMQFLVLFADGSLLWLPWSFDIFTTVAYERYVSSLPALRPLLYTVKDLRARDNILNDTPITEVTLGTVVFVDLRCYGYGWYAALGLPDCDKLSYVVPYKYEAFNDDRTVATVFCHLFKERWKVNHVFVIEYGSNGNFDSGFMKLIDSALLKKFPSMAKNIAAQKGKLQSHLQSIIEEM